MRNLENHAQSQDLGSNKTSIMQNQNHIVVLTGPSGVGKSTLVRKLLSHYGPNTLKTTVSYTTRPRRGTEKQGVEYYFVSRENFLSLRQQKFFVEWSYVYENYYATAKEELEKHWKAGRAIIKDFDLRGAYSLKKLYPQALVVFIAPPSLKELNRRLQKRQENHPQDIHLRIQQAKEELKQASQFDQEIINKNLKQTITDLKHLIDPYLNPTARKPVG